MGDAGLAAVERVANRSARVLALANALRHSLRGGPVPVRRSRRLIERPAVSSAARRGLQDEEVPNSNVQASAGAVAPPTCEALVPDGLRPSDAAEDELQRMLRLAGTLAASASAAGSYNLTQVSVGEQKDEVLLGVVSGVPVVVFMGADAFLAEQEAWSPSPPDGLDEQTPNANMQATGGPLFDLQNVSLRDVAAEWGHSIACAFDTLKPAIQFASDVTDAASLFTKFAAAAAPFLAPVAATAEVAGLFVSAVDQIAQSASRACAEGTNRLVADLTSEIDERNPSLGSGALCVGWSRGGRIATAWATARYGACKYVVLAGAPRQMADARTSATTVINAKSSKDIIDDLFFQDVQADYVLACNQCGHALECYATCLVQEADRVRADDCAGSSNASIADASAPLVEQILEEVSARGPPLAIVQPPGVCRTQHLWDARFRKAFQRLWNAYSPCDQISGGGDCDAPTAEKYEQLCGDEPCDSLVGNVASHSHYAFPAVILVGLLEECVASFSGPVQRHQACRQKDAAPLLSLRRHPSSTKLADYFRLGEFVPEGSTHARVSAELVACLDRVRKHLGYALAVTSAYTPRDAPAAAPPHKNKWPLTGNKPACLFAPWSAKCYDCSYQHDGLYAAITPPARMWPPTWHAPCVRCARGTKSC
jgi:hypothetical protein